MSDEIVLKTEDLTKHYGGVHALEGANFEMKKALDHRATFAGELASRI